MRERKGPTGMDRAIQVVVCDKNPWVVSGLRGLFEADPRFALVAEVADGQRLLDLVRERPFDVGVTGWVLPGLDGRGVLSALRNLAGAPSVVVYTGALDPDIPRQVMALGGAGFCPKRAEPERLLETVAAVAHGNMVFPRMDVTKLYDDPIDQLTGRELQLLAELAEGATNAGIARRMGISANTVKFHLKNLYDKLGVQNRVQAIAYYVSNRARSR
jgi:two-component system nitrate/nitrite response regulator NarP